jgi:Rrf2 family protein
MLSSTAEYALRSIVYLASHSEASITSQDIARGTQVPRSYVSKVLRDLSRAGLVGAQRGPNGGFILGRNPESISVLEVVNAVDPIRRIKFCPLGIPSHSGRLCKLHQKLDDAIALVEESFRSSTLADLADGTKSSARCVFPPLTVDGKPQAVPAVAKGATKGAAKGSSRKASKPKSLRK